MSDVISAAPGAPGREAASSKVFRTELNPVDFLHRAAYMYPEKTAVVHGTRRYTYRQLAERSWRLANALRSAGSRQGRPGGDAAVQLPADAGGPLRRARGGRDPGRGQQPPGQRRSRLHPPAQRCPLLAARHPARGADRAAGPSRRDRDPLRRHRPPRGPVRGTPGRRLPGTAGKLAGARGRNDLDQLHLRHHRPPEGRAVHLPRRLPERAQRGHRGRPEHRFGVPVDAADVPLQRLVLPVGGHRGRGAPRDPARGGPAAHLGTDRR